MASKAAGIPASVAPKPYEASSPNMPMTDGHHAARSRPWIVDRGTVAVLLDMDPDDLNNLGAMRNAFWTSMSVNTGGSNGPADPDTWQWKLDAFNQGPAIAALTDWENGPKELRGPNMPLWKPIVQ